MEVSLHDGSYTNNIDVVLDYWKNSFSNLYNARDFVSSPNVNQHVEGNDLIFNASITIVDVKRAVDKAKVGKAIGADNVYAEILKNDAAVLFLHSLFNIYFDNGIVPSIWNKCIINPIPKSSCSDPRDPSYVI